MTKSVANLTGPVADQSQKQEELCKDELCKDELAQNESRNRN